MGIPANPISVSFRALGFDKRILDLPNLLKLPSEPGWEPREMTGNVDDSGNPLINAGVVLIKSTTDRSKACARIAEWLDDNADLIRDLKTEYKCIQIDCCIDKHAYDGFVFLPELMEKAVLADCPLSSTTYREVHSNE